MSSFIKTKLKSTRELIGKRDFAGARDAAQEVLSYEPDNYNANVFLGLSLLELGQYDQSERAYLQATKDQPGQLLAWQGLCKFYEQTERWDKYVETLRSLMDMYAENDDASKCADQLQKLIDHARRRDSSLLIRDALSLLLPSSPLYPTLSTLPPPDPTSPTSTTIMAIQTAIHNTLPVIEELVSLTEKEEQASFNREFDKRRTRLDAAAAGPEGIRKQVGKAIWGSSKLPDLYDELINYPRTSDDQRRDTESKLLRYKIRLRNALELSGEERDRKLALTKEIHSTIDGIVLLKIADEMAWQLYFEMQDVDEIDAYDADTLNTFLSLFPESPLAKCVHGFFLYTGRALSQDEGADEPIPQVIDDPFDFALEGFAGSPDSLLAHRMAASLYLNEEDYQPAITVSENGLLLVRRVETESGIKLVQAEKYFKTTLATGLIHLFPPKHHKRAIPLLEDVINIDPRNVRAHLGRGYILQTAHKWDEAAEEFLSVSSHSSDGIDIDLVAREEHAWCNAEGGSLEAAAEELQSVLDTLEALEGLETRKARVWWRLGLCHWRLKGTEKAYRHFITSLKRSPSFAPAFTSLGIYYLEGVSPPDTTRATKCFQKAFELDAREVDAARRLAHAFAEEREWDLVNVVAQRVIEGEGGLGGGLSESEATALARYKPTNAWAWKALGVVELNNRNYPAAIHALQVALRSGENDAILWTRLGEAYSKAGRHAAAVKALSKSLELAPDDWMTSYLLADVHRQMGHLKEAIEAFEVILHTASDNKAILLSLSETYLAQGRAELATGYLSRSASSFLSTITFSAELAVSDSNLKRLALKPSVDALIALSGLSTIALGGFSSFDALVNIIGSAPDERLEGIVTYPVSLPEDIVEGKTALRLAAALASFRISLFTKEQTGYGTAWYDLSLALGKIAAVTLVDSERGQASKQATDAARHALIAEPTNTAFWNHFANLNFVARPAIAQHAYVRALECDPKDAGVWTNLGLFYLHHEDLDLANNALLKAQTLDPDYTLAWVGQGLVASANSHAEDSNAIFEHAISLAADIPAADIQYAYRAFRQLPIEASRNPEATQNLLLPPFFALDRYCRRNANDPSALHLFGLVCERLHLQEPAIDVMSRAIKQLEALYEESEDPIIERKYAIANANLGRLRLGSGDLEGAVESFETAFSLLSPDDASEDSVSLRALCSFGSGIAFYHLDNLEEAVMKFEAAQDISENNAIVRGHVTVLLAKTLWQIGSDDFRESAKERLLDCINQDPENLTAVTALAAMGLLTNDESLIDAALSEILSLPVEERHTRDPDRDVEDLLVNHHLAEGRQDKASSVLQSAFHSEPESAKTRASLASFSISRGQPQVAQALLSKLLDSPEHYLTKDGDESLRLLAISLVTAQAENRVASSMDEAKRTAQKAIKVAPWEAKNWLTLAVVNKSR